MMTHSSTAVFTSEKCLFARNCRTDRPESLTCPFPEPPIGDVLKWPVHWLARNIHDNLEMIGFVGFFDIDNLAWGPC